MKHFFLFFVLLWSIHAIGSHDKYRLMLRDDPSTTVVIGWNQISGNDAQVYYDTMDHGTNYLMYTNVKAPDRIVNYKGMNNTYARLTGLQPNTAYYFVIRDNQQTSQRFWFKTAPADKSRLSFIAGGDSRNNRTPRKNANLLVSKLKPNAVLFGGDMTDRDSSSQWQTWFNDWQLTIASDGRMFPIVATRGNHEDSNSTIHNLFDTPSSSIFYALTFGDNLIRTYTLNTEISISGNQTTWLANDLKSNTEVDWKIAQYHKPMRPHVSYKSEGNSQYNNWARLFFDHGVQLVVECDAHTVKTTWPIRPATGFGTDEGFIRDDELGTVYVGEGCWGAPLRNNSDTKSWTRNAASFNQFKWIFVDEDLIETRTVKIDNAGQVGEVSNNNVFQVPANLDIWNPSNGGVIKIYKRSATEPDSDHHTVEVAISEGNDDVEEDKNGKIYEDSSDLELVYDSFNYSSYQTIGLRFRSVNIPRNAMITEAYLQFTADESNSNDTSLEISLHSNANSPQFSDANNVSGRTTFSQKIVWTPPSWSKNQRGNAQRSPDLKKMLQNLIDLNGWASGNSLSLLIKGKGTSLTNTSAKRVAESFESGAAIAPRLIITYKTIDSVQDICTGVAPWSDQISYQPGDRVLYVEHLFEKTNTSWDRIGACGMDENEQKTSIDDKKEPPLYEEADKFMVTPNPFTTNISISAKNVDKNEIFNVAIYSLAGKLLYNKNTSFRNNSMVLYPQIQNSGMYIVTVKNKSNTLVCTKQVWKQ